MDIVGFAEVRRKKAGMNITQFASHLGISKQLYSAVNTGKIKQSYVFVHAVCTTYPEAWLIIKENQ